MKHAFSVICLLAMATMAWAAPFYVKVNQNTYYAAAAQGEADFQGRTQYAATCIPLQQGDVVLCYDHGSNAAWAITVIDPYGAYQNFTCTAQGLTCNVAGTYDFYIKLKFEDDMWYVGESGSGCTPAQAVDPNAGGNTGGNTTGYTSAPQECPDVLLQAFYWDSFTDKGYGRTKWIDMIPQATEIGKWFDLVWLPPSSKSSGGTGYLPIEYASQDGDWGTKLKLLQLIDTLHANGCRVVADMVVNHAASSSGWCSMAAENFGPYGTFSPTMSWICSTDEAFTGGHCTQTPGGADDGYGSEANYDSGRDWDHNNTQVRDMFKAYAKWLRYVIGYDGFRYDYCKGFHMSHVNEYNTAAHAYFSVLEYWDGNVNTLQSRLNDAAWNTLTFDFATKYTAFNDGIAKGNYGGCKGAGLLGAGKSRYAVTFVDSHDSFQRDGNEFCGAGNSMNNPDKLLQANAFMLSMPGVPCVFYPHWVTFKADIKAMINARYKTGVHSESAVQDEAGNGFYKATITGKNGQIRLLLGPNSGYATTPNGFTKAASGNGWGVYYKVNSACADKDTNRTALTKAVDPDLQSAVEDIEPMHAPAARKVLRNGQLYLDVNGVYYSITGQRL